MAWRRALPVGTLAFSACLYLWNNNFPIGYHGDEGKKIHFALTNTQDFQHPLLLLQAIRAVNVFLNLDPPGVALLGRTLRAIYAVLLVACFYLVVRELLPFPYDLLAALLELPVTPVVGL